MEYAIQLLLPILGGLWLGDWLSRTYGLSPVWMLVLAILGMLLGLGVLYKRYALSPRPKSVAPPEKPPEKPVEWRDLDFLYKNENDNDDTSNDSNHDADTPSRPKS